jgi:hypothetical protein
MRGKLVSILLAIAIAASAQMAMTVDQLVSFVRSSVERKTPDRDVAAYLPKVRLSNRLDDATIEELQRLGAGPRTVAALRELGDASAKLPAAPATPAPREVKASPPPDAAAQKKALDEATEYALNYEKNLPNFLCTQVTRRFQDSTGTGTWRALDTVNENLSYFEHHEKYKVVQVNGKMVDMDHEKLQGAVSSGEFGSIMKSIFAPETQTQFAWERWGKLRDEIMQVYSYHVELSNSNYHIAVRERSLDRVTAYHGLIFVDQEHHFVHRLTLHAEGLPPDFPVQDLNITLDYGFEKIGDMAYLLPLKFDLRSKDDRVLVKNEVDYHFYRKFGTETTIKFDTPDPIPEEKTKEKPIKK